MIINFVITCTVDISDIILMKAPNEQDLLNLLADISNLWAVIGIGLEVPMYVLESIQQSQNRSVDRLSKVINNWITTQPSPVTWKTVITVCEQSPIVDMRVKADEIRQYLHEGNDYLILNLQINDIVIVFSNVHIYKGR